MSEEAKMQEMLLASLGMLRRASKDNCWNDADDFIAELEAFVNRLPSHWSDCAVHNEPAMQNGPCDCGGIA